MTPSPPPTSPVTMEPTTSSPVTPEPTTASPVTPEPTTASPATPEPTTASPVTPEPTTASPMTLVELPDACVCDEGFSCINTDSCIEVPTVDDFPLIHGEIHRTTIGDTDPTLLVMGTESFYVMIGSTIFDYPVDGDDPGFFNFESNVGAYGADFSGIITSFPLDLEASTRRLAVPPPGSCEAFSIEEDLCSIEENGATKFSNKGCDKYESLCDKVTEPTPTPNKFNPFVLIQELTWGVALSELCDFVVSDCRDVESRMCADDREQERQEVLECCGLPEECGDGCYDPEISQCCEDGTIVSLDDCCSSEVICLSDGQCYKPEESVCCLDGVESGECCQGEQLCGGVCCAYQCCDDITCFEATSTKCCPSGAVVPTEQCCPEHVECDDGSCVSDISECEAEEEEEIYCCGCDEEGKCNDFRGTYDKDATCWDNDLNCCGSGDPCCGNDDPCCGSDDPCCGWDHEEEPRIACGSRSCCRACEGCFVNRFGEVGDICCGTAGGSCLLDITC